MTSLSQIGRTIRVSTSSFLEWLRARIYQTKTKPEGKMSYIRLYNKNYYIGEFNLPTIIKGDNGLEFKLMYVLIDGAGGNGVLFQGQKFSSNFLNRKDVAIKVSKQQDPTRLDRFKNEIRIVSELKHENIATYYESGEIALTEECTVPWIAMELCGCNLQRHVETNGALPLDMMIKVGVQMCDALNYFHSKDFIHRDIKPANFVWARNNNEKVKMIDFGIAKKSGEDVSGRLFDNLTKVQEFVGPVFFSSPELIAYSQDDTKKYPVDYRSDIFQLGKVFWYLATTKVSAGIPSKRDCSILWDLIMNMIQDNPNDRIQSADEVKSVLLSL
jgi:serine/threonine protein kinase